MTMIRPKIKGLPMTKSKGKSKDKEIIGSKGKGDKKGEFLGDKGMIR